MNVLHILGLLMLGTLNLAFACLGPSPYRPIQFPNGTVVGWKCYLPQPTLSLAGAVSIEETNKILKNSIYYILHCKGNSTLNPGKKEYKYVFSNTQKAYTQEVDFSPICCDAAGMYIEIVESEDSGESFEKPTGSTFNFEPNDVICLFNHTVGLRRNLPSPGGRKFLDQGGVFVPGNLVSCTALHPNGIDLKISVYDRAMINVSSSPIKLFTCVEAKNLYFSENDYLIGAHFWSNGTMGSQFLNSFRSDQAFDWNNLGLTLNCTGINLFCAPGSSFWLEIFSDPSTRYSGGPFPCDDLSGLSGTKEVSLQKEQGIILDDGAMESIVNVTLTYISSFWLGSNNLRCINSVGLYDNKSQCSVSSSSEFQMKPVS